MICKFSEHQNSIYSYDFAKKDAFCENTIYPYVFENNPFFSIFFKKIETPCFFKIIISFGSNYKLVFIFPVELWNYVLHFWKKDKIFNFMFLFSCKSCVFNGSSEIELLSFGSKTQFAQNYQCSFIGIKTKLSRKRHKTQ